MTRTSFELELQSERASLRTARRQLRQWLSQSALSETEVEDFLLAAHEALANAIIHGNQGNAKKRLFLHGQVNQTGREVVLVIGDEGQSLDWDKRPASTLSEYGRGLPLIEALVDEVEWGVTPGEVRLRKVAAPL